MISSHPLVPTLPIEERRRSSPRVVTITTSEESHTQDYSEEKDLSPRDSSIVSIEKLKQKQKIGRVEKFWRICETSKNQSKLILSHDLNVPYYLSKPRSQRINQSDKEIERERKRLLLTAKKSVLPTSSRSLPGESTTENKHENINSESNNETEENQLLPPQPPSKLIKKLKICSKKEEMAAEKVLAEFRSREAINALKERIKEKVAKRSQEQEERLKILESSPIRTMTPNTRRRIANERREKRQQREFEESLEMEKMWREKVENSLSAKEENELLMSKLRQRQWLMILISAYKFYPMVLYSLEVRNKKNKDKNRWNYAKKIQKAYRQYLTRTNRKHLVTTQFKSALANLRALMKVSDSSNSLYNKRVESATLLVKVLKIIQKQWKVMMFNFLSRVKVFQRIIKTHYFINQHRLLLLVNYIDKIYPVFISHVQLVLDNRGLDMHNLTPLDQSFHRLQLKNYSQFHIVNDFFSEKFHYYLRRFYSSLPNVDRFCSPTSNIRRRKKDFQVFNKLKKKLLLDLLYRKRYQWSSNLDRIIPNLYKNRRVFTEQEILQYIKGEIEDPLKVHLLELKKKEDKKHLEYLKSGRTKKNFYTQGERCLCLLNNIQAEEIAALFIKLSEAFLDYYNKSSNKGNYVHRKNVTINLNSEVIMNALAEGTLVNNIKTSRANSTTNISTKSPNNNEDEETTLNSNESTTSTSSSSTDSSSEDEKEDDEDGEEEDTFSITPLVQSSPKISGERKKSIASLPRKGSVMDGFKPLPPNNIRRSSLSKSPRDFFNRKAL